MDELKVWKTVLENLKLNLSTANFSTWFPQTFINAVKAVDQKRQIVEIACPNAFARNTVENRYYSLIKDALDQITEKKCDLVFIVKGGKKIISNQSDDNQDGLFEKTKVPPAKSDSFQQILKRAGLRADFNFDNFAVSSTNQMAHAAAMAVSKSAGQAYNPLFLYGGVGVGKTHLMQAVAQEILLKTPQIKVIYCTSEDFTNEIVNAIRSKATDQFKNKYRSARLLLVDDIQFIAGKDRAQEEFFHIFNTLHQDGKQIILSSDRAPKDIPDIQERLISRFNWGLSADLQMPEFETRYAILERKANDNGIEFDQDILEFIALNFKSNVRELEGAIIKLLAMSSLQSVDHIDLPMAKRMLKDMIKDNRSNISIETIQNQVAEYFGIDPTKLKDKTRKQEVVEARQIAMFLSKMLTKATYKTIGLHFGGRDHSTVIHAISSVTDQTNTNAKIKRIVKDLQHQIELSTI